MNKVRFPIILAIVAFTGCKKPVVNSQNGRNERKGLTALVTKDGINLRKSPTVSSPVVSVLAKGDILNLLSKTAEREQIYKCPHYWFQATSGQKTGWVYGEFLADFIDTNRQIYTTEKNGLNIEMSIPESWHGNSSVLLDSTGAKIMETLPPEEVSGDFENAIRARYKSFENSEHPYKVHSIENISHQRLKVFRVITETGFEGGCPNWVGQWYPVGYHFQIADGRYFEISFYLRDINDKDRLSLFDQIAKTVNFN